MFLRAIVLAVTVSFIGSCGPDQVTQTMQKQLQPHFRMSDYVAKPFNGVAPFIGDPTSPDFFILQDGFDLGKFDKNKRLKTRTGVGTAFGKEQMEEYKTLKGNKLVHWIVRDLESGTVIGVRQDTVEKTIEGASVPKALVAAAALNKNNARFKKDEHWFKAYELLVESINDYWNDIQALAGGAAEVNKFSETMGYEHMRPAHDDSDTVNALYLAQFLYDIFHDRFVGSEPLYKIMAACNTGRGDPPATAKGPKYIPTDVYMGGKTGTWNQYQHDMRFLRVKNHWYAIVVLSETGKSEDVAIMFGGIFREYLDGSI